MKEIEALLFDNQDEAYGDFQSKLIPNIPRENIIGVRTPKLRGIAKKIHQSELREAFLLELPHKFFEENQLHGFIVSLNRDFNACIEELEAFLPYIDNWATCDQTSPNCFKKHADNLLPYIERWLNSAHTYTVRFAIGMLMKHFLDERFKPEYAEHVAAIRSDEYYVNMEIAWYIATALAKQWNSVIGLIENKLLDKRTHNKAIQKAIESYRVTDEQKAYLRTLKVR